MADVSRMIEEHCSNNDSYDEGVYEQGDCSSGGSTDDEILPPLSRVQKYAESGKVYDRQMVPRLVQELFRTAPPDILAEEIPGIMAILQHLAEKDAEVRVRADLLEQIPHIASQALKYSSRVELLKSVIGEYLLPLVVRNLGCSDKTVDKAAHSSLIHLLEQDLITKPQAEIQVCPAILALATTNEKLLEQPATEAINLMSRLAPLLGRDVTERIFLSRFVELCSNNILCVREVCASHIGNLCAVVGKEKFEKILLPCYLELCQDAVNVIRKACAEVVMFVSVVCPPELRRNSLAPVFANLLQDNNRWVQMAAFQTLGPFIATFAEPSVTQAAYNEHGTLILINNEGHEFLINTPLAPDIRFCKYLPKQPSMDTFDVPSSNDDWWDYDENLSSGSCGGGVKNFDPGFNDYYCAQLSQPDRGFADFLENATLGIQHQSSPPSSSATGGDGSGSVSKHESNLIKNVLNNMASKNFVEGFVNLCKLDLNPPPPPPLPPPMPIVESKSTGAISKSQLEVESNNDSDNPEKKDVNVERSAATSEAPEDGGSNDKVNLLKEDETDDENLQLFNSYNYWYISPAMPLDLSILSDDQSSTNSVLREGSPNSRVDTIENAVDEPPELADFDSPVVPKVLVKHFILMTNISFSLNFDNDMSYHCAYSLPAVAKVLEKDSWPVLRQTIVNLASDMHYKVRRTLASSLHELALIMGREIATEHLTPIFEGFLKDLDEVRIGVLKHLAHFLRIITPEKRVTYLPRLQEFLKTELESNWRFRHELGKQLLLLVTLFKPVEAAKHIGHIAEYLLQDVAAVRQVAVSLITELLRHISTKPQLNSHYLDKIVGKFAHSTKWKRRQSFALLCDNILSSSALPLDLFTSEIMPHLLDLSWDPVANVRLVVAKTIAQQIILNEYWADPSSQQYDNLGTVIRRLQSDKDRDVRQYAEIGANMSMLLPSGGCIHSP